MSFKEFVKENTEDEFGYHHDGWNKDDLRSLVDWCDDVAKLTYEIKMARRGAYDKETDGTMQGLIIRLSNIKNNLHEVIGFLESEMEQRE